MAKLQDKSQRARPHLFGYKMFYHPQRKHERNGILKPVEFEWQQDMKTEGIYKLAAIQYSLV